MENESTLEKTIEKLAWGLTLGSVPAGIIVSGITDSPYSFIYMSGIGVSLGGLLATIGIASNYLKKTNKFK